MGSIVNGISGAAGKSPLIPQILPNKASLGGVLTAGTPILSQKLQPKSDSATSSPKPVTAQKSITADPMDSSTVDPNTSTPATAAPKSNITLLGGS